MLEILINYKKYDFYTKRIYTSSLDRSDSYNKNIDNTSRVMLEMINSATKSITLVGYLIQNGSKKIFNALYNIQLKKNIKIRFIFNDGDKYYNKIRTYWPESEKLPPIYTYKPKKPNTSLHAKIIIIDSCDILVTSANLPIMD